MRRVASEAPISFARWVAHLNEHEGLARAGDDPEGVHQVRVAVARLRALLALAGERDLDAELRWLRDATATVRDLDVQIAHAPPARWAKRLRRRRARAQHKLARVLDSKRLSRLRVALARVPPAPRAVARCRLDGMIRRALRRGRTVARHPCNVAALHELRCSLRRVRYALEALGEEARELATVQDAIGVACDRFVALRALGHRRARRYRRKLEHELRHATTDALAAWERAAPRLERLRRDASSAR